MKKIFAVLLSLIMLVGCVFVYANETAESGYNIPEKVEISFNVGDNTLVINGEEVTSETAPYVVETEAGGVTLVPVRVITEAFGAKVGWEEATQTVTLDYPDVKIVLQIGNPVAEVNGEAVTLLTSPELPGGRTMVPIRFISETFGAEVGYDDATRAITVVKENIYDGGTVVGAIENTYVGNSEYNWMMLNPKGLTISSNDDDGTYIRFVDEEYNSISVTVTELKDDYDFEDDFKERKKSLAANATLSKADKNTENPEHMTMHFVSRSSQTIYDRRYIVVPGYQYQIVATYDNANAEVKTWFTELADSFKIGCEGDDIHDFTAVADEEARTFKSEELGIKLVLPENFGTSSNSSKFNVLNFSAKGDSDSEIYMQVVSKSEASLGAKEYLDYYKKVMTEGVDTEIIKCGDVTPTKLKDFDAYVLDYTVEGTKYGCYDEIAKLITFDLGDYSYRIQLDFDVDDKDAQEALDALVESMEFTEIDAEKVGIILDSYEPEEEKDSRTEKIGEYTFDVPGFLELTEEIPMSIKLESTFSKISLSIAYTVLPAGYTPESYLDMLKLTMRAYASDNERFEFSDITQKKLGDYTYYSMVVEYHYNDTYYEKTYMYVCEVDSGVISVTSDGMEFYEEYRIKVTEEFLATLKKAETTKNN